MSLTPRKLRNTIAAGALATLTAFSLAGCAGGSGGEAGVSEDCTPVHEFETVTPGTLTIASYDYPPYTLIEGSNLTGIEGDLLNKIAEMECLSVEVMSAGGAGAVIPSIETGRADIGTGSWYRTTERAEIVRLGLPIVNDESAVISTTGLTSDDLDSGIKVASVAGNLWNDSVQKWLGDDFAIYQDDESIYGDLAAGRIDAIVASAASAVTRFDSNPIDGATVEIVTPNPEVPEFERPGQVNWPSGLDNEALGEAIDADLETLREDGRLIEILEAWGIDPVAGEVGEPDEL